MREKMNMAERSRKDDVQVESANRLPVKTTQKESQNFRFKNTHI